jgi:hypothetical protein
MADDVDRQAWDRTVTGESRAYRSDPYTRASGNPGNPREMITAPRRDTFMGLSLPTNRGYRKFMNDTRRLRRRDLSR